MKFAILLISLALLLLTAYRSYDIKLSSLLKEQADIYEVKAMPEQPAGHMIRFGSFSTDLIKKGWSRRYDIPFFNRFSGAKEKLSYHLYDADRRPAYTICASGFSQDELEALKNYFHTGQEHKDLFAGTVFIPGTDHQYNFVLFRSGPDHTSGYIRWGLHQEALIESITELEGKKMPEPVYSTGSGPADGKTDFGYAFKKEGKTIGAVQVFEKSKVWMDKELSDEFRLVLASVSAGLMMRDKTGV